MQRNDRTVRLAEPSDARAIAEIYAPVVETTAISFEDVAPDEAAMHNRIAAIAPAYPWLVLEERGVLLGYAYAGRHRERAAYRWSVDVSAYVRDTARGRGVGAALYRALFRILEVQGFHGAFAGIALPNDASVALHRSLGFTAVGVYHEVGYKHGAWHDVSWWERRIGTLRDAPNEPIALSDLPRERLLSAIRG